MTTVTVSLPAALKSFIEEQVATKGFGNVSEYVRSLLRDAQDREEASRLEKLLLEGLASGGQDGALDEAFWIDLRAEASALAKKHRKKTS